MKGHIRQRGRRSWAIKIDLGKDPVTRKRRTKWYSVKGTKRDAERARTRIVYELDEGIHQEPSKTTVTELLEDWLEFKSPHRKISARTGERYKEIVSHHLIPLLGHHRLQELSWEHIDAAWSEALVCGRRDGRGGLSPQTIRHLHRVLSQALKYAVKKRLVPNNQAALVDPIEVPDREMTILDPGQAARLLEAIAGTQVYMPVFLALTTGLRRSEILGLRWCDVHLDQKTISVVQGLKQTKEGLYFGPPKSDSSRRTIVLPALAVEELLRHRAKRIEERMALGLGFDLKALVVCRKDGKPLQPRSLTHEFTRMVARLKDFPRVRFHDLRHTHISHLLLSGVHPKVAQERAGHSSFQITMDTYSHATETMQADAAQSIDTLLRTAIEQKKGA